MRNTSAIRRIDDLGRVVIPKEIRQALRLKANSEVKVVCDDGKSILITPHSKLNPFYDVIKNVVNSFDESELCFVCDNFKVIASTKPNITLSESFFDVVQKRENIVLHGENLFKFAQNSQTEIILPLICNGDILGSFCVCYNKFLDNFNHLKPTQTFLQNYLSEF